jgi:hypothetical protein
MSDWQDAVRRAVEANALHRPVDVGPDVVRRTAGPSTETVHSLLRHIRAMGLDLCPGTPWNRGRRRAASLHSRSRRRPGLVSPAHWSGLVSAARLLRTIHDAGADWTPPEGAVWGAPSVAGEQTVFCHGDPGHGTSSGEAMRPSH